MCLDNKTSSQSPFTILVPTHRRLPLIYSTFSYNLIVNTQATNCVRANAMFPFFKRSIIAHATASRNGPIYTLFTRLR